MVRRKEPKVKDQKAVRSKRSPKERLSPLPEQASHVFVATRGDQPAMEAWRSTSVAELQCQQVERWDGMS